MELRQYLQIAKRWAWLLVLGLLLGAAAGYQYSKMQVPVYQAYTRAMVMSAPTGQSSDYYTYYSDLQLVQTYMQLLTTRPVLEGASKRLGYEVSKSQVKVKQNADSQIIELTIEDGDPQRAADIANVLVQVLIEQNESLQSGRYATTEQSIRSQISAVETQVSSIQASVDKASTQSFQEQLAQVKTQIQPLQDELSSLQQQIAALTPADTRLQTTTQRTQIAELQSRISQIQPLLDTYQQIYSNLVVLGKPVDLGSDQSSRLTQLQSTLDLYQQLYLNLLSSLETVRLARMQNTPNIVQIEEAARPSGPVRPRPLNNIAMSTAIGLMLAAGIAFLVEYLDDTLKTPEDVERVLGLNVLGFVADMRPKGGSAEEVYIMREPRSPISEAFRSLRTNLECAGVEKPITTILVSSPGPGEGKTTVAVNLAAIFSQARKRVVLVDADMRRPRVHHMLGVSNREGLSNLFLSPAGMAYIGRLGRVRKDLPRLLVVSSGALPPNPAELLGSKRMDQILEEMRRYTDMVIIDTPPSIVADAQILSAKVDAVLLVIQPGKTRADTARASMDTFQRAGARVVGVVMNRIPRNRGYYYGGYKYYSPYGGGKYYFSGNGKKPAEELAGTTAVKLEERAPEQPVEQPVKRPAEQMLAPIAQIPPAASQTHSRFGNLVEGRVVEQPAGQMLTPPAQIPPEPSNGRGLFDKLTVVPPPRPNHRQHRN